MSRGYAWLQDHGGNDCRAIVEKYWPDMSGEFTVELVDQYRRSGMWEGTVAIGESKLARWQGFMRQANLVDAPLAHSDIVDGRPYALAQNR